MSIDVLPCTSDDSCTHEDQVLDILKNARERYANLGIRGAYIVDYKNLYGYKVGSVCAIGAIGASVGLNSEQADDFENPRGNSEGILQFLEGELRESTRQAIELLEDACVKLYPDTKFHEDHGWSWAIEDLNENVDRSNFDTDDFKDEDGKIDWKAYENAIQDYIEKKYETYNKPAVLSVYDYVIAKREAACLA